VPFDGAGRVDGSFGCLFYRRRAVSSFHNDEKLGLFGLIDLSWPSAALKSLMKLRACQLA
jgi:hypothetical protein